MTQAAEYRKKPVVIEAIQLVDGESFDAIMRWRRSCTPENNSGGHAPGLGWWIKFRTLEGEMTANQGDWIIRGIKGEFYPCKPDIFEATYEQVTSVGEREEHLRPTRSDRGFVRMPEITGTYPGTVSIYESSGASQPQIWLKVEQPADLNVPEGPWTKAIAHLSVEAATQLAQQLLFLVEYHYQTCDHAKREQVLAEAQL